VNQVQPEERTRLQEFANGWRLLFSSLIGLAFASGMLIYNSMGFAFPSLQEETGWALSEISLGLLAFGLTSAALAPLCGYFADTVGERRIALIAIPSFGLVLLGFSLFGDHSLLVFYGLWVLLAVAGVGSLSVTWTRAVNVCFVRGRGLALGILLMGTSVAAVVVPQIAVFGLAVDDWRGVFRLVALLPLLIAFPLALFLFRIPKTSRASETETARPEYAGISMREALLSHHFWILWFSLFFVTLAFVGAQVNLPGIVEQHGYSKNAAANLLGVLGLSAIVGRVVAGILLDRFWGPGVCFPLLMLPVASFLLMIGDGTGMLGLTLSAAFLGFATGVEGDLLAYLTSRYFGLRSYGRIAGLLFIPIGIANAISPYFYALSLDQTGNYNSMLWVAAGLFTVGAVIILFLGPYPSFDSSERSGATT